MRKENANNAQILHFTEHCYNVKSYFFKFMREDISTFKNMTIDIAQRLFNFQNHFLLNYFLSMYCQHQKILENFFAQKDRTI